MSIHFFGYVSSAASLYEELIEPAEDLLGSKDLVVVPDGILHHVPFEALLTSHPEFPPGDDLSYRDLPFLIREFLGSLNSATVDGS